MNKNIKIPNDELWNIYNSLKSKGFTIYKIKKIFGAGNFRNSLYGGWSCSITTDGLKKLNEIYGSVKIEESKTIDKNDETAELIGMLLGDGCLYQPLMNRKLSSITFYFNITEYEIAKRAQELCTKVLGFNPSIKKRNDCNLFKLQIKSDATIEALKTIGMQSGSKIENQVSIPEWIKDNEKLCISCARGLVDTDGSVYFNETNDSICISFTNASKNLLNDFVILCDKIGVRSHLSKIKVQIQSKNEVSKFLDIVKPIKWIIFIRNHSELKDKLVYKDTSLDRKNVPIEDILQFHGEKSIRFISKKLHLSQQTIKNRYLRYGIELPNVSHPFKLLISKIELENLIWNEPISAISTRYGVSDSAIIKRCKKLGIERPGRGYWQRMKIKKKQLLSDIDYTGDKIE